MLIWVHTRIPQSGGDRRLHGIAPGVPAPDDKRYSRGQATGGPVMSLSPREQHALDSIRDRLAGSDPELAALLATFTRLASGEQMPARGPVRAGKGRHPHRGQMGRPEHPVYQRLGFYRVALLLWVVITIALITTAMAFDRSSEDGCSSVAISAAIQRSCAAHDAGLPAPPPGTR